MIILSKNSIITYNSQEPLDLMNPPPKDSANNLYADYFNFITNIVAIYDTQTKSDTIPVFITRASVVNGVETRVPDSNSTLQRLVPGNAYKVIVLSDTSLPLSVPNPLSLEEFGYTHDSQKCLSRIDVSSSYVNNNIILSSNTTSTNIELSLSKLLPYETYSYVITPVFSNWPAKLAASSGTILYSGPENNGFTTGKISSVFSYYPNIANNLDSIPYTINADLNKTYYNNNIFTVLNIKIINKDCILYDNNFIIRCNECVNTHSCPSVTLTSTSNQLRNFVHGTVSGLIPNIDYSYKFQSINANWPAHITPLSGILKAKDIESGIANIHAVFTFALSLQDNSNLDYILDPYINNINLLNKLSNELELKLEPINNSYCSHISSSTIIQYNMPSHANSYIKFENRGISSDHYPILGDGIYVGITNNVVFYLNDDTERPGSEINISPEECCHGYPIKATLYNLKLNELYTYSISSYPDIRILPSTGTVASDSNAQTISALAHLDGQKNSVINIRVTHEQSQKSFDGSIMIRCLPTGYVW